MLTSVKKDPDARPLADLEPKAMVPMGGARGRPRLESKA
jgi:hypothetical protein